MRLNWLFAIELCISVKKITSTIQLNEGMPTTGQDKSEVFSRKISFNSIVG